MVKNMCIHTLCDRIKIYSDRDLGSPDAAGGGACTEGLLFALFLSQQGRASAAPALLELQESCRRV